MAVINSIAGAAINQVASVSRPAEMRTAILNPAKQTGDAPFSDLFNDAMGEVSRLESEAHHAMEGLMSGSGVDVHQAMIATQKASMAFELSLAVRNKAVQAYQQLMGMQF